MKSLFKFAVVSLLALAGFQSVPGGTTDTAIAYADFQGEIVGKRTKIKGSFTATGVFKPDGTVSYTNSGHRQQQRQKQGAKLWTNRNLKHSLAKCSTI